MIAPASPRLQIYTLQALQLISMGMGSAQVAHVTAAFHIGIVQGKTSSLQFMHARLAIICPVVLRVD